MKILHILRSAPDDIVRKFIEDAPQATESIERPLYRGEIDYDQLLNDIFESDRVICWW